MYQEVTQHYGYRVLVVEQIGVPGVAHIGILKGVNGQAIETDLYAQINT